MSAAERKTMLLTTPFHSRVEQYCELNDWGAWQGYTTPNSYFDVELEYSYTDGEFFYFMDPVSFEQHSADETAVGSTKKWLKEQERYDVTLYNGAPLAVTPPNFIELEIIETDPGLKGDTAQGGSKPATLSTGAVVRVPLFISQGEVIKVDTRSGEYVSRAAKD